eukprot:5811808-Pleurochrysis_carterae.AAC.3
MVRRELETRYGFSLKEFKAQLDELVLKAVNDVPAFKEENFGVGEQIDGVRADKRPLNSVAPHTTNVLEPEQHETREVKATAAHKTKCNSTARAASARVEEEREERRLRALITKCDIALGKQRMRPVKGSRSQGALRPKINDGAFLTRGSDMRLREFWRQFC